MSLIPSPWQNTEPAKANFSQSQELILIIFIALAFWYRPKKDRNFRDDAPKSNPTKKTPSDSAGLLADAKLRPRPPTAPTQFALSGIRLDLPAHEILGVSSDANRDEIQKAYRELMKRYHPDRVGPSDSREWKDASLIADALTAAKEKLLKAK